MGVMKPVVAGPKAAKIVHTLALRQRYASLPLLSLLVSLSPISNFAGSSPFIILALSMTTESKRQGRDFFIVFLLVAYYLNSILPNLLLISSEEKNSYKIVKIGYFGLVC